MPHIGKDYAAGRISPFGDHVALPAISAPWTYPLGVNTGSSSFFSRLSQRWMDPRRVISATMTSKKYKAIIVGLLTFNGILVVVFAVTFNGLQIPPIEHTWNCGLGLLK